MTIITTKLIFNSFLHKSKQIKQTLTKYVVFNVYINIIKRLKNFSFISFYQFFVEVLKFKV